MHTSLNDRTGSIVKMKNACTNEGERIRNELCRLSRFKQNKKQNKKQNDNDQEASICLSNIMSTVVVLAKTIPKFLQLYLSPSYLIVHVEFMECPLKLTVEY